MGVGVAKIGDVAGGPTIGPLVPTVVVNGLPIVVIGTPISPHPPTHIGATMIQGSKSVFAGGASVCRLGDKASCDHTLTTSSSNVFVG